MNRQADLHAGNQEHFLFTVNSNVPDGTISAAWPTAEVATAVTIKKLVEWPVHGAWLARREGDRWLAAPLSEIRSYAGGNAAVYVVTTADGCQMLFASNGGDPLGMACEQVIDYR